MPILLLLALGGGGFYLYKKKQDPSWTPFKKKAALSKVKQSASAATPTPTAGLDPNMTTEQVAAVNAALSTATDPAAVYALASNLSETAPNSAKALITKADALTEAKKAGVSDAELLQALITAGTYAFPEGIP